MEDFNTTLRPRDRSSNQKINKKTQALSDTLCKMGLIDIYKKFHLEKIEYTFFSTAQRTFFRLNYTLSDKSPSLNFIKLESYQASFLNRM